MKMVEPLGITYPSICAIDSLEKVEVLRVSNDVQSLLGSNNEEGQVEGPVAYEVPARTSTTATREILRCTDLFDDSLDIWQFLKITR